VAITTTRKGFFSAAVILYLGVEPDVSFQRGVPYQPGTRIKSAVLVRSGTVIVCAEFAIRIVHQFSGGVRRGLPDLAELHRYRGAR
jgi:hypothetical protein